MGSNWLILLNTVCQRQIKARKKRSENPPSENDVCTMCDSFCAIKVGKKD